MTGLGDETLDLASRSDCRCTSVDLPEVAAVQLLKLSNEAVKSCQPG
jgi:hypothetical protein